MPLLTADARGVHVIAPTPFHPNGRVDEASADRMADFFLGAGVAGITVLGQLGEGPKLDHAEAVALAARVARRGWRRSRPCARALGREGSMRRSATLRGNGGLFLETELGRGADGANTGYCFPRCWSTWPG